MAGGWDDPLSATGARTPVALGGRNAPRATRRRFDGKVFATGTSLLLPTCRARRDGGTIRRGHCRADRGAGCRACSSSPSRCRAGRWERSRPRATTRTRSPMMTAPCSKIWRSRRARHRRRARCTKPSATRARAPRRPTAARTSSSPCSAHELRNPLAPIGNGARRSCGSAAPDDARRGARDDRSSARSQHLVAAGRRPARRLAHHPRQDRAAQASRSTCATRGRAARVETSRPLLDARRPRS